MENVELINFLSQNWSLFLAMSLWSLPWKGVALWQAAKKGHQWWFIIMLVTNTVAILEIIYLFFVVKIGQKKNL